MNPGIWLIVCLTIISNANSPVWCTHTECQIALCGKKIKEQSYFLEFCSINAGTDALSDNTDLVKNGKRR